MTMVDQVTFRLERFGWSAPDRLKLVGRWHGAAPEQLELPVLVARDDEVEHRMLALPAGSRFEGDGRWSASFQWTPELSGVREVELELGSDLALGLPLPNTHQRRFGRPSAVLNARVLHSLQEAESPAELVPSETVGEGTPDASPLDLHSALIQAQQDLDEARADAQRAHEELTLARRDVDRERDRRQGEVERMRDALTMARSLAEEQLQAERAAGDERLHAQRAEVEEQFAADRSRLLAERDAVVAQRDAEHVAAQELQAQVEEISNMLAVERLTRSGLREEVDALHADVERAARREQEIAERHGAESASALEQFESARSQLAATHEALALAAEEGRRREQELERLRSRLVEAQQLAGENQRLSAELEELRRYASELEPLRARLDEASARIEELEAVSAQLVEAERRVEQIAPLQARLAEVSRYAEQVGPLRAQLAEARATQEHTTAEADDARRRLEAVRRALDGSGA